MKQHVLLDFDGFLTRIEPEAKPIIQDFLNQLYNELQLTKRQATNAYNKALFEMKPEDAWHFHGHDTCRWDADPYIQASTIASKIYKTHQPQLTENQRANNLTSFFQKSQNKQKNIYWRTGTETFLNTLLQETHLSIITNSNPTRVHKHLQKLNLNKEIPLYGNAQKYFIDQQHTQAPKQTHLQGLNRPILLRRKHYHHLIQQILPPNQQATFAGDIYEFDLALPQALGHTVLLANPNGNSSHEQQHLKKHSKGLLANNLQEALEQIL